jgi:ATP-dependent RNA helicase DBP3
VSQSHFVEGLTPFPRLVNVLKAANQPVPEALLKFGTTVKKKEHSAYGAFYKDVDMSKKATKITFD